MLWTAPLGCAGRASVTGAPAVARRATGGSCSSTSSLDEDRYSEVDAHYVPDADVAFARLSEPKNYRHGPDPVGRTVLCAEVPATVGDARWSASDDELGELVLDGMARIGLRVPDRRRRRGPPAAPRVPGAAASATTARGGALALGRRRSTASTVLGRQGLARRRQPPPRRWTWRSAAAAASAADGWDDARWAVRAARFDAFVVDD